MNEREEIAFKYFAEHFEIPRKNSFILIKNEETRARK